MRAFDRLCTTYAVESLEPISDFDHIADRVVVRTIWHGVGQGPELNMELTIVYAVRAGLIVSLEYFWDYAEALDAVGLRSGDVTGERGGGSCSLGRPQARSW
jgi:ketosteroid isomerase-like protein